MTVAKRVFQTSDLTGATRRDFITAGQGDQARLRTPDGTLLVLVREASLQRVTEHASAGVNLAIFESAIRRPREQRRPTDFGDWAFLSAFDEEDLDEFRAEVIDGLVLAAAQRDLLPLLNVVEAWRRSARTLSDPVAREILAGESDVDDWLPATPPAFDD